MSNFTSDFQQAQKLIDKEVSSNSSATPILEEIKKSTIRNILSSFGIPSEAYFTHLDKIPENYNAEKYDSKAYHQHDNYKDLRKALNTNGGADDYLTGKHLSASELHIDHKISAKTIHEVVKDPILKLFTNSEDRENIANDKDNLAPLQRSLNQSKGANDLDYWGNRHARGQDVDNKTRFGIDSDLFDKAKEENQKFLHQQRLNVVDQEFEELTSSIRRSALRSVIAYYLYKSAVVIFEEIKLILKESHESIREFCRNLYNRKDIIWDKIKASIAMKDIKKLLSGTFLKSGLNGILSLATSILMAFLKVITGVKFVFLSIRTGLSFVIQSLKVMIKNGTPNKMQKIASIFIACMSSLATVYLADLVFGWLPDFPFKEEVGYVIAGIGVSILSILLYKAYQTAKKNLLLLLDDPEYKAALEENYSKCIQLYNQKYQEVIENMTDYYDKLDNLIDTLSSKAKDLAITAKSTIPIVGWGVAAVCNTKALRIKKALASVALAKATGVNDKDILKNRDDVISFLDS